MRNAWTRLILPFALLLKPDRASHRYRLSKKQKQAAQWSWRLSGLVTLADWVGSDPDYFSFKSVDTRLEDYWDWALNQAEKALGGKGLLAQSPESRPSYARFAPQAATRPRPMQKLAEEAPLKDGAQLFILEETTGAGKTETAIMLAAPDDGGGKRRGPVLCAADYGDGQRYVRAADGDLPEAV